MSTSSSFQVISSLRYDPSLAATVQRHAADSYPDPLRSPYYLIPYHLDRLRDAAECFQWVKAQEFLEQDLAQFIQFLNSFIPDQTKPWRLRIVLDCNGSCTVEPSPVTSTDIRNFLLPLPCDSDSLAGEWRVYVDSQFTTPSSFTKHKTTVRDNYAEARLRSGIVSPLEQAEVLVVNPQGSIMEGSITTPYFRRRRPASTAGDDPGPEWTTPLLSCGGNSGTTRRYAIAQGFCTEGVINAHDLVDGEECWLSNGVRGFIRGRIVLSSKP
ncbi:D-aminoacid aminotransferase-like PLP-dependent enzyme [Aspergillus ambiguus]|uniref:D-aminoacid aminotransferase-like PLP-dependent enzyme n=1 Tax=Aspergillus ambiguus TaxID=176160 RepID=UPI003CCCEB22